MDVSSPIKRHGRLIIFILLLIFCLYSTFLYLTVGQRGYDKVLSQLAAQFMQGNLSLSIYNLPVRDISNYYNNFYVYFGPLASILLIPGVFFQGDNFPQVTIGVGSMIISFLQYISFRKNLNSIVLTAYGLVYFLFFQLFYLAQA